MTRLTEVAAFVVALAVAAHAYERAQHQRSKQRCISPTLANGRVRLKSGGRLAVFQCHPNYFLVGDKFNYCNSNRRWENPPPRCVRSGCRSPTLPADTVAYQEFQGAVLRFYCAPDHQLTGPAVVYCNGRTWSAPAPVCQPAKRPATADCDFEDDTCGWSPDLNHDYDWVRLSAAHNASGTRVFSGPRRDHTLGNATGHYLHAEQASGQLDQMARLVSLTIGSPVALTCVSLWVHIRGGGELNLYGHPSSRPFDLDNMLKLLTVSGDLGDSWRHRTVELPSWEEPLQLVLEARSGESRDASISVDDVSVTADCSVQVPDDVVAVTDGDHPIGTCDGRCGVAARFDAECSCVLDCVADGDCCPDYIAFCDTDGWTSDATETPFSTDTTPDPASTWSSANTTAATTTTTAQATTRATRPPTTTTRLPTTTTRPPTTTTRPPTTTTRPPTTTTPTTKKPTKKTTIAVATTRRTTRLTRRPPPATTTTMTTSTTTTSTTMSSSESPTRARSTLPTEVPAQGARSTVDAASWRPYVVAAGGLAAVAAAALCTTWAARRWGWWRTQRGRISDSCSDVRFLASDELLDFTLKTA